MESSKYWDLVKAKEPQLKADWVKRHAAGDGLAAMCDDNRAFITSVENPMKEIQGGRVVEVNWRGAAMQLVNGTHRMSTLDEVTKYHEDAAARGRDYATRDMRRQKKQTAIVLTPEQVGYANMPQINMPQQVQRAQAPQAPQTPLQPPTQAASGGKHKE